MRTPDREDKMRLPAREDKTMTAEGTASTRVRYRYVGDGLGVPGLPHEVESKSGLPEHLQNVLEAALENGEYERVSSSTSDDDQDEEDGD